MSGVGARERVTQDRVVALFRGQLKYIYLGRRHDRENTNIETELLREYLAAQGYSAEQVRRALNALRDAAGKPDLNEANKAVYALLRYGASVREHVSAHHKPVKFINWDEPHKNDFYIAEEVTVRGAHTKRPDIVLYINGIAVGVLELKRSMVSVSEGIRQNLDNQRDEFIRPFFATIQLVMAGNDTEGLRYGVIDTPEKYFTEWKEDRKATDELSARIKILSAYADYRLDRHLISLCEPGRLLDLIHNFIVHKSRPWA